MQLGPHAEALRGSPFYYGKGCEECHHTGYRGRVGIFEVMRVDQPMRTAILDGDSSEELRRAAIAGGMRTLRESGLRMVTEGRSTIEEVLRETGI
jgi:type IV pilus assembly protein PilB